MVVQARVVGGQQQRAQDLDLVDVPTETAPRESVGRWRRSGIVAVKLYLDP